MELSRILAEMVVAEIRLTVDSPASLSHLVVEGLAYDSRRVQPGFVFFCIPGKQFDGHDFAPAAVNRGAVALVVERFLPVAVPQILVESARENLALAAAAFYAHPAGRLLMVGVTGTNGKTTTCHLIEAVLWAHGYKVGVIGTIGNRLGKRSWPATHTTPESLDLQALLAGMANAGADAVVMEVSSHALEQQRVQGVEFDLGVFTNLTQDHLDYHGTLTNYRAAKARLFTELGRGRKSSGKKAIINADDPEANYFAQKSAVPVISYGIDAAAAVRATGLVVQAQGTRCNVAYPGGTVSLSLQLTGRFNVANALAAFTVGLAAGVDPDAGARALAAVPGVPGRFEVIKQGQPFSVVVDYAHTPDGLENVLTTARTVTGGRVITVFGCGGDRDRTKRPKMGSVVARLSDLTLVTSDNPRTEDPENIIGDIIPGIQGVKGAAFQVEADRAKAIRTALKQARPGDLVLIAGKGHETYQVVGKTVLPFDDRKVAGAVLREMGYARG